MVHLLITGDTGTGDKHQKRVAHMMKSLITSATYACVLLGDNIYEVGTNGVTDKQFQEKFEKIYKEIMVPFYLLLGNHDWGNSHFSDGRHMSQVAYTNHSEKWNLPSRYYHQEFGNCDFFFLDTNFEWQDHDEIQEQYNNMLHLINKSKQRWKILCGHHTWRSVGGHGNAHKRLETFLRDLVIHSEKPIHLYMCGHDHCKNVIHLKISEHQSLYCVVIGTGGKPYDDEYVFLENIEGPNPKVKDSELLFHSPTLGLCELKSSAKDMNLTFHAPHGSKGTIVEYKLHIR